MVKNPLLVKSWLLCDAQEPDEVVTLTAEKSVWYSDIRAANACVQCDGVFNT